MFTGKLDLIRQEIEELKTQQALTSQAVENHMSNEELLMKAHNEKLDSIITMIKEDRTDNKEFKENVGKQYITKGEFNNFKKAIGWVIFALVTFAGAVEWAYSQIHPHHEQKINYMEQGHERKESRTA